MARLMCSCGHAPWHHMITGSCGACLRCGMSRDEHRWLTHEFKSCPCVSLNQEDAG